MNSILNITIKETVLRNSAILLFFILGCMNIMAHNTEGLSLLISFYFMDDATILYVQQSEIEKFKKVFSGTVLPLEEYVSNINHITSNQATKTIYDLQGRRLSEKPAKGIYIQNGKKIVTQKDCPF